MIYQTYNDIYDEKLAEGAIINDRHTGHKRDYLLLVCLLKKYKPKSFFEIGTNSGFGTMIIKNALGEDVPVYSLDLPNEESYKSKQHPISEGKEGVGYECELPYTQLWGDSKDFNYTEYLCEGYFCDGEHTYENVLNETFGMLVCEPKIIIYHDADVDEVCDAIVDAMEGQPYNLFRITDTRIAYAIKK